jgi:hypothetical protein
MSDKPHSDKNIRGVPLPAQLNITEAAVSAARVKQERDTPDPTSDDFEKLIKDAKDENS